MNRLIVCLGLVTIFYCGNLVGQILPPLRTPVLKTGVETYQATHFIVGEVKGSVPSKAVYLAKPEYPVDARWSGVEGTVRVQITIDNEGNVKKTEVLSGDALLAAAAEDAARRTKFRIARNEAGQAIEASGILAYTFEIRKAGWSAIAYGLSGLDRLPVFTFSIPTVRKAMEPDWVREREMLEKLDDFRKDELPIQRPVLIRSPVVPTTNGTMSRTQGRVRLPMPAVPSAEQKVLANDLISALAARVANDELSRWQFDLGLSLRESIEQHRNPYGWAKAAANLRSSIEAAPAGAAPKVLAALKDLEAVFSKPDRSAGSLNEVNRLFSIILD